MDRVHPRAARRARVDGIVRPNSVRPLVRGVVDPRRVGAFYSRACAQGLLVATGDWQTSDDTAGRNGGKPSRTYRFTEAP